MSKTLTDTDLRARLQQNVAVLGGDITSRHGQTAAALYRAAELALRGTTPVTLDARFRSARPGHAGPQIRTVLLLSGIAC